MSSITVAVCLSILVIVDGVSQQRTITVNNKCNEKGVISVNFYGFPGSSAIFVNNTKKMAYNSTVQLKFSPSQTWQGNIWFEGPNGPGPCGRYSCTQIEATGTYAQFYFENFSWKVQSVVYLSAEQESFTYGLDVVPTETSSTKATLYEKPGDGYQQMTTWPGYTGDFNLNVYCKKSEKPKGDIFTSEDLLHLIELLQKLLSYLAQINLG